MNIEILQEYIETFTREIVDSGFKRDLDDYNVSLPNAQNNIVNLRDIAGKVLIKLESIYRGDLPEALRALLPYEDVKPFTETRYDENLKELVDDTEVDQQQFFSKLNQQISRLRSGIQQNITKVNEIENFIEPYLSRDTEILSEEGWVYLNI